MKLFIKILLCTLMVYGCNKTNLFKNLDYDKVIAYEFNGNGGRTIDKIIFGDKTRLNNEIILSKKQINSLEKIITKPEAYGQITAACFDPHFAIIYYKNNQRVAQVDVCLMCNYLVSSVKIPSMLDVLFDKGKEYERPAIGFSKKTRKELDMFIKNLGFTKYNNSLDSIFDE